MDNVPEEKTPAGLASPQMGMLKPALAAPAQPAAQPVPQAAPQGMTQEEADSLAVEEAANERARLDSERGYHEVKWHNRPLFVINDDPARTFTSERDADEWVAAVRGSAHVQQRAAAISAQQTELSEDE